MQFPSTQRQSMKLRWTENFQKIINHSLFRTELKHNLNLSGYKITKIKECHIDDILSILSYNMFELNGCNHRKILMSSSIHTYQKSLELEHSIDSGLNFVLLDENEEIFAVSYGFDYKDQPLYPHTSCHTAKEFRYIQEMDEYVIDNDRFIQSQFDNDLDKNVKYGQLFYSKVDIVKPDTFREGYMLTSGLTNMLIGMSGYKYRVYNEFNPMSLMYRQRLSVLPHYFSKEYDFKNFVFKDGRNMTDIINDFGQQHHEFSNQSLELTNNDCKEAFVGIDFEDFSEDFESEMERWFLSKQDEEHSFHWC